MATDHEIDIVARTLFGEARGESVLGMIAVAWVIKNRADNPGWWGRSVETVCLKPYQFSCWNADDPNAPFLRGNKIIPPREYMLAREAAVAVLEGHEPDPTGGATHYYSTSMRKPPKWAASGTKTVQIGRHIFYRDVQ